MLIGQDFDKLEVELFGLIIQEPNGIDVFKISN